MNWRAELLKIWVLFSALWFIAWGAYGFSEWRQTTFMVTAPTGLRFQVLARAGTSNDDVLAFVQNSDLAKKLQEDCSKQFGPECQQPQALEMPYAFPFVNVLLKILAAPLAVFAFGVACFWIIARFRRSADYSSDG